MKNLISLLISCLATIVTSQLFAQLNTSLLQDRLNFNEGTTAEATFQYDGTSLILETTESNGNIFLNSADNVILDSADDLLFRSGGGNTRMFIGNGGNIGIGTNNPNFKLDILSDNFSVANLKRNSSNGAALRFENSDGVASMGLGSDENVFFSNLTAMDDGADIVIYQDGNVNVVNNLGIGTTNPKQKLDVSGDIALTNGTLRFYDGQTSKSFIQFGTTELEVGGFLDRVNIGSVLKTKDNKVTISTSNPASNNSLLTIVRQNLNNETMITLDNPFGANRWTIDVGNSADLELFSEDAGNIRVGSFDNNNGNYTSISDARLKTNIQQLEDGTLTKLMKLQPSSYYFKHDKERSKLSLGFLAQEVEKIFPELVVEPKSEKENYMLSYSELGVIAIKAIQELNQKVEGKESEKTALQQQISDQQQQIEDLEQRLAKLEQLLQNTTQTDVLLQGKDKAYLKQNAPNPFHENTIIEYYLPESTSQAYLRITDQNGVVLKLVQLEQTGQGQVNLTAKELPSGTYTYTLILDGEVLVSKQMVLTK